MINNQKRTTFFLIHCISLAFLFNAAVSYPLWLPEFRTFPQINASFITFCLPTFQRYALLIFGLLGLIGANINLKYYKTGIGIFLSVFFLLVLEDINRLQPYFYFYAWIFTITALYINHYQEIMIENLQRGVALLFGACYFWSGVYKCNTVFPASIAALLQKTDINIFSNISPILFYLIPAIEILLGIEFLELAFKKEKQMRSFYFFMALLLHLGIISLLWLSGWNKIVISWNFCMILVMGWLLWAKNLSYQKEVRQLKKHLFIAFFVGFLPALHLFGYWDGYLSWQLYSGIAPEGRHYLEGNTQKIVNEALVQNYKIILFDAKKNKYYIDIRNWLLAETHIYFYPEKRYFQKVKDHLEKNETRNF